MLRQNTAMNKLAVAVITVLATVTFGVSVMARPAKTSGGCCGTNDCHITADVCNGPDDCGSWDCCYSSCL
jgi:hypothetical protein